MKIASLLAAFLTAATVASAAVTPLPGSTPQSAPVNTPFLSQVAVRVTDASGNPVPYASIYFSFQNAFFGTGYDASKFSAAATGTYTLRFPNAHNATLEYSIDGHSGSVALIRQAF